MLKRFISYYKPHMPLFILDISVAFASSILAIFFPFFTWNLLKVHLRQKDVKMVYIYLALLLGVFIIRALMEYVRTKWGHILGVRMEYDMRADFFRHIQKLSFNYFDNVKTGHIMSRISNDLNTIAEVAHHAPEDLLVSLSVLIGAFVFMFIVNAKLAFIAMIPLPLMLAWGGFFGLKVKKYFRNVRKRIADINSTVENSVQGIREVKSYANEEIEISKFDDVNCLFRNAKEEMYSVMALFFSGMRFLRNFYSLTVIAGGSWLIFKGELEPTDLLVFLMYVNIILRPIERFINFIEQFQRGAASFERFMEVMDIEPDITDKKCAYSLQDMRGEVEIKDVTFHYITSHDCIIKNINIKIAPGERVAIVGESGAGKSTIVSLIPRFYEPQEGKILVDGNDIMDLKQRFLRQNIGIVQQDVFLFDDTIRGNIMYGDYTASEQRLIEAAQMADIYDFIQELPDGFDTVVGERGVKLSGGQKQRVSIARVFLKDPRILIFDEATSSLDSESEGFIQEAMLKLSENRTTIIIAHRLSTVKNVDRIYVLKEGEIVEIGTHKELIEKGGYYCDLYSKNLL